MLAWDVECARPHSMPTDEQMEDLPSAPPLPDSKAHAPHAASSAQSWGPDHAQRGLYPGLHASDPPESASRPALSQNRQEQGGGPQSMGGQTGNRSLGSGATASGQGGESAEAGPAVQPAGGLAWAVQTAACASGAAMSALTAWLPWHPGASELRAPQREQQQRPNANLQATTGSRR